VVRDSGLVLAVVVVVVVVATLVLICVLFVCLLQPSDFKLVFVGVVTVVFVVALCVYVSLSLSQECWRSWQLMGCLFFRELRSGSCVQNEGD
jgi:O-antigen ligase